MLHMQYKLLSVIRNLLFTTVVIGAHAVYAETVSILLEPEKWTLMTVNMQKIPAEYFPEQSPYISLHDNNEFDGFLGCSDVTGKYSATNSGAISFSAITATNKYDCTDYVLTLDQDFMQILTNAKSWSLGFIDSLRLYDADKQEIALLSGLGAPISAPQQLN